jgi:homopolymeric O-antigen transport system ATP-binding protein
VSDLAIRAHRVSKRYRLGQREHYRALRDVITNGVSSLFRPKADRGRVPHLWALKDVSFEVRQGEVVGVIGRNGAGKSTLLKVLSRITEPTAGYVDVKGRAGSLLEVGTGFHPELTGRENIFLNAAILGMRREETIRKFDEIVAFAEVEPFIDTVVKHYSSGMYMRLAFAVAAHLEPEILIVDEVLAVGDTAFQKKCLGKMGEIAQGGRPVIFVSHNMSAVHRLCTRAIVMHEGQALLDGSVDEAVREYIKLGEVEVGERTWPDLQTAPGDDVIRMVGIRTRNAAGAPTGHVDVHDAFDLEIDYVVRKPGYQICAVVEFLDVMGTVLILTFDDYVQGEWGAQEPHPVGLFRSICHMPADLLSEGDLSVNVRLFSPPLQPNDRPRMRELGVLNITVNDRMDPAAVRARFPYKWSVTGLRPRLAWSRVSLGSESPDVVAPARRSISGANRPSQ